MRPSIKVDTSGFDKAIKNIDLTADDILELGYAGSAVVKMHQKTDVPKDLGTTRASISDHIKTSTRTKLVDEIGPETKYAPYLEFGTGEFAESGTGRKGGWVYPYGDGFRFTLGMKPRPFVRPSAHGQNRKDCISAIDRAFRLKVRSKWQK